MKIEGLEITPGGKKIISNGLPVEMLEFASVTGCVRDFYERDSSDHAFGQLTDFSQLNYSQHPIIINGQDGFVEWIEDTPEADRHRAHRCVFANATLRGIPARLRLEYLDESRQNNSLDTEGDRLWGVAMWATQNNTTIKASYGIDPQERPTFKFTYFYPDAHTKRRYDYVSWAQGMVLLGLGRQFEQVRGKTGIEVIKDYDFFLKSVKTEVHLVDRQGSQSPVSQAGIWQGQVTAEGSPYAGLTSVQFSPSKIEIVGGANKFVAETQNWDKIFSDCTDFTYEAALLGLSRLLNRISLNGNTATIKPS